VDITDPVIVNSTHIIIDSPNKKRESTLFVSGRDHQCGTLKDPPQVLLINRKSKDLELKDILHGRLEAPFDILSFEKFCSKQRSVEELKFWKEIQIWKSVEDYRSAEKYEELISQFVLDTSPYQVNLPGKMFKNLRTKCSSFEELSSDEKLHVFDEAENEIFTLMRISVFPLFLNRIIVDRQLSMSKTLALWWKQKDLTWRTFFTFPDAINIAESRLHAFCSGAIALAIFTLALIMNYAPFAQDIQNELRISIAALCVYLSYGFLARVLCGPRLDIQAFLVLFVIRPFVEDFLGWIDSEFEDAKTARWLAQVVGGMVGLSGSICLLFSIYFPESVYAADLFIVSITFFGMMVLVTSFSCFANFCVVCWAYFRFKNIGHPKSKTEAIKIFYLEES
jgi:hypothetical protein